MRQFDSEYVNAQLVRGGQGRDPDQVLSEAACFGLVFALILLVLAGAFLCWASRPNPEAAAYGSDVEVRM